MTRLMPFAVCCMLFASAPAQWLDTTLVLPDSFGGLQRPRCLAVNTANNRVYVGGQEGEVTIAIDGTTSEKIARIPTGYFAIDMGYNPISNKIYSVNYYDDNLTVIDGATN